MKRLITAGLMLVSAFALTNCADEIIPPAQENDVVTDVTTDISSSEGIPYEVIAEIAETKTDYNPANGATHWHLSDEILVYSSKSSVSNPSYNYHNKFKYDGNGKFLGKLSTALSDLNDWYYIYGASSATTETGKISAQVTIGATSTQSYTQTQQNTVPLHMAGPHCPMYGIKRKVSKSETPKVSMSHLYSTVAIKIINEGAGGGIIIDDLEFEAPEAIVGQFNVNILGDFYLDAISETYVPVANQTSTIAYVDVRDADNEKEYISIPYGGSSTVYFAIKPFNSSNKDITIRINGSERKVTMPDNMKFDAGKTITFNVPVKELGPTLESDGFLTSTGRQGSWQEYEWVQTGDKWYNGEYQLVTKYDNTYTTCDILTFENFEKRTNVVINGETCSEAYVVGTTENEGYIKIQGWAKEMINALPIGFYASRLDDAPTAMTLDYVDILIPEYNDYNYASLKTRKSLGEKYEIVKLIGWDFDNGITRDFLVNTLGIDAKTITFNGVVANGYFANNNIVVMNEDHSYKGMSESLVEAFIKKFGQAATLEGLRDILNADFDENATTIEWTDAATTTGQTIYNKIKGILDSKADSEVLGGAVMILLGFPDYQSLMYKLRDMKFELCIKTYPYATSYGETEPTGSLAPIVFWGLDATTDADRQTDNEANTETTNE